MPAAIPFRAFDDRALASFLSSPTLFLSWGIRPKRLSWSLQVSSHKYVCTKGYPQKYPSEKGENEKEGTRDEYFNYYLKDSNVAKESFGSKDEHKDNSVDIFASGHVRNLDDKLEEGNDGKAPG